MPSTLVIPSIALGGLTTPPITPPGNVLVLPRIAVTPTPPTNTLLPGLMAYTRWWWDAPNQQWVGADLSAPWDQWPLGYYVSAYTLGYGSPTLPDNVQVVVVNARRRPDGSFAPNVLTQPPPNALQSDQCPAHMFQVDDERTTDPTFGGWCAFMVEQPPQQTQNCPPGTIWDPATETCKALPPLYVPPIYVPPPPDLVPPPLRGQPEPEGDEITDNLCAQMAANTDALVYAIQQLQQQHGLGDGNISKCCASVVIAIGGVTSTLSEIFSLLSTRMPAGGGPPLDLTPIVQQLSLLVTAVASLAGGAVDLGPVTVALDSIRDAIASAPGTDVSAIVEQLRNLFLTIDVPQAFYERLEKDKYLPKGYAALMGQGDTGSGVVAGSATSWRTWWSWMVDAALGVSPDAPGDLFDGAAPSAEQLTNAMKAYVNAADTIVQPAMKPFLDVIISELKPATVPPVGQSGVDPDKPVASAVSVALTAGVAAWLVSYLGIAGGEPLSHIAELVAGAIGFEELRDVQIGPLIRNGIAKVAEQQAKALFQQELPANVAIAGWVARGLMDPARAAALYPLNGLHFSLSPIAEKAAYSGINARSIIRLISTGLFSDADVADELTFSGMRPASQHRMIAAAPYLATEPQRNQLRAALESAFVNGLLSEADLTSNLDSAEHNTDRSNLIVQRVKWQLLTAETKKLETEYTTLFKSGLIDDSFYRAELGGLGLQPGYIDIIAGVAEAAANATLHRKELTAAARLDTATKQDQRKAARQAFKAGTSNAATLGAALLATDLTPAQVAAQVTLAELQSAGVLRWIHGLQLPPAAATLLKDRVSALTDQRKRQQITDLLYVSQLQALNIPDRYINALRAAADAMISPKTAAVVVPVLTT
jgi:hypothetical protein